MTWLQSACNLNASPINTLARYQNSLPLGGLFACELWWRLHVLGIGLHDYLLHFWNVIGYDIGWHPGFWVLVTLTLTIWMWQRDRHDKQAELVERIVSLEAEVARLRSERRNEPK